MSSAQVAGLVGLSVEQLSNIAVTSVSDRAASLHEATGSACVITSEDIQRSAAISLPQVLRLAPDFPVAQLDAARYSISARGFNNAIGNKRIELGHRSFAAPALSCFIPALQQHCDKLRSSAPAPAGATLVNQIKGMVNGLEVWANWQASSNWSLGSGFLTLHKNLLLKGGSVDVGGLAAQGNDPRCPFSQKLTFDFGAPKKSDAVLRRIGIWPSPEVAGHAAVDARLAWQIDPQLELSVPAQNLLHRRQVEFNAAGVARQNVRRVFLKTV